MSSGLLPFTVLLCCNYLRAISNFWCGSVTFDYNANERSSRPEEAFLVEKNARLRETQEDLQEIRRGAF